MNDWWLDFFKDDYSECVLTHNVSDIFSFINHVCTLCPGDLVFDQCCGKGYLSGEFIRNGFPTMGVDASKQYIDFANKTYGNSFICADARKYVSNPLADVGINWHSSLFYSKDDNENKKILQAFSNSLKPGAEFIISTGNPEYVLKHFQKFLVNQVPFKESTIVTIRESSIDEKMLCTDWLIIYPDGTRIRKQGHVKMYTEPEIVSMLSDCNLKVLNTFGNLKCDKTSDNCQTLIFYGRKHES